MRSFYRSPKYFPDVVCEGPYQTITGSKSMYASMYVYKLTHIYKVGQGFVGNNHRRCNLLLECMIMMIEVVFESGTDNEINNGFRVAL